MGRCSLEQINEDSQRHVQPEVPRKGQGDEGKNVRLRVRKGDKQTE